MKLKLNGLEMLMMADMLPARAKVSEAIICGRIREKLTLSQEDQRSIGLRIVPAGGGQMVDCKDKETRWTVEFDELETDYLIGYARAHNWPTTTATEPLVRQLEDASGRNILTNTDGG